MTLSKRHIPTSFESAAALLNSRGQRRIGANAVLFALEDERGPQVVLKLHNTNIVTYRADGSLVLDTGGWMTRTTQSWMNCALRGTGFAVWSVKGALAVHHNGAPSVYLDGSIPLRRQREPLREACEGGPNDDESRAIYDNLCDREGCTHARISEAS